MAKFRKPRQWRPVTLEFLLRFYDAYSRTHNLKKVAAIMEMSDGQLHNKIGKEPDLQAAMQIADFYRPKQTLSGYVFSHLSQEAQAIWKKITQATSLDTVQALFKRQSRQLHQELFIYALVKSSFNISEACRIVGLNRITINKWKHDLAFMQMMEEAIWLKKDFFESALIQLVEERHPGAVLFVNRTVNKDRGYGEQLQIEHSGSIGQYAIEELDLDLDTRKKVLEALRKKKAQSLETQSIPPSRQITLDVEKG